MSKIILYTREHSCPEAIKKEFLKKGVTLIEIPLISTVGIHHQLPKEKIDWIFFTSANTVKYLDRDINLKNVKIASIGNKTTEALIDKGIQIDFQPTKAVAEVMAQEWLDKQDIKQVVFLPNSKLARPILSQKIESEGHVVHEEHVYTTYLKAGNKEKLKKLLFEKTVCDVMLSSPSIWAHFKETADELAVNLKKWRLYSIGPITTKAIEESGETVYKEAAIHDMAHLYAEILEEFD